MSKKPKPGWGSPLAPPPPGRPSRFGLRTWLVVILIAAIPMGIFAWIAQETHERREMRAWVKEAGGDYVDSMDQPFYRFGRVSELTLPKENFSDEDAERIKRVFPEAALRRE